MIDVLVVAGAVFWLGVFAAAANKAWADAYYNHK